MNMKRVPEDGRGNHRGDQSAQTMLSCLPDRAAAVFVSFR
jgi:hypothetical protein